MSKKKISDEDRALVDARLEQIKTVTKTIVPAPGRIPTPVASPVPVSVTRINNMKTFFMNVFGADRGAATGLATYLYRDHGVRSIEIDDEPTLFLHCPTSLHG